MHVIDMLRIEANVLRRQTLNLRKNVADHDNA